MRIVLSRLLLVAGILALLGSTGARADDKSLYQRIGGEKTLRAVLDDFYDRLQADPRTSDRFSGVDMDRLKQQIFVYVSQHIGGPHKYSGKDMKTTHRKLKIEEFEWAITLDHMSNSLDKENVPAREKAEFLDYLETLKGDITVPSK